MYIKRQVLTFEALGKAINRLRFKSNIWAIRAEDSRVFRMVNDVRWLCDQEPMTRAQFDEGIQYFNIFHQNYEIAREEFRSLCAKDW